MVRRPRPGVACAHGDRRLQRRADGRRGVLFETYDTDGGATVLGAYTTEEEADAAEDRARGERPSWIDLWVEDVVLGADPRPSRFRS